MNMGLLAGAASRGITEALQGINQGTLQGEQINQGRAARDLQYEHLGLQRDQMANTLAQQSFANTLAQRHSDYQQKQLEAHLAQIKSQDAYHTGMLKIHGDEAAYKSALLPYLQQEHAARSKWYDERNRAGGAQNSVLFRDLDTIAKHQGLTSYMDASPDERTQIEELYAKTKRTTDPYGTQKVDRYAAQMTHYADMHDAAVQKLAQLNANPKISAQDKIRLMQIQSSMRSIRMAIGMKQKAIADGVKFSVVDPFTGKVWNDQTLAEAMMAEDRNMTEIGKHYAPQVPGAVPGARPGLSLQDAQRTLAQPGLPGLTPRR